MENFNLRKFVAPEIIFGVGARKLAGQYARNLGAKKVMIVTDKGVIDNGWIDGIKDSLEKFNIDFIVYSDVTPNPRSEEVTKGTEIYKQENCNAIIAVGGGSPMDCAKGIGIVSTNKKNILEFEGIDKIQYPCPPLIFIPTTAGTSSDISQFSIISNRDNLIKIAIISKAIVPDVALVDPETTTTMDSYLTACTGIDALVHAIEAYVSTASSPITDIHALQAISLIREYLPKVIKDPYNLKLREQIMLASMEAGLAFSNAILGAVHAMAHSLGGFLDLPHGECNAILLEHVVSFNYDSYEDKFDVLSKYFDIETKKLPIKTKKDKLLTAIKALKTEVGITNNLSKVGVKIGDIPTLSKKAANDPCILTNPRKAKERDIEVIYEEAL